MPSLPHPSLPRSSENETIAQTRERLRRAWGDYPLTILIINPINLRLVRLLGRTSVTPNQLTLVSFLLMIISAFCLASTTWIMQVLGGIFLLSAYQIDCLDGDLARFKSLRSPLGAMLDPILDRFGEFAITMGAAINGWLITGQCRWLIGGIILAGMSQIYFYLTDAMLHKLADKSNLINDSKRLMIRNTRVRFGAIEPYMWGQAGLAFAGIAYWGIPIFGAMFTAGSIAQTIRIISKSRTVPCNDSERLGTHKS